jgi:hypothetical protein
MATGILPEKWKSPRSARDLCRKAGPYINLSINSP